MTFDLPIPSQPTSSVPQARLDELAAQAAGRDVVLKATGEVVGRVASTYMSRGRLWLRCEVEDRLFTGQPDAAEPPDVRVDVFPPLV